MSNQGVTSTVVLNVINYKAATGTVNVNLDKGTT